jgi:hypothetical protein
VRLVRARSAGPLEGGRAPAEREVTVTKRTQEVNALGREGQHPVAFPEDGS